MSKYKCRKCGSEQFYRQQSVYGYIHNYYDSEGKFVELSNDLVENGKERAFRCCHCDSVQKKMTKELTAQ